MTPVADNQLLLFPSARPLAERFDTDFIRTVPERPGVYLMSTARDGVLYVGKAKNLRRRLSSYRSGTAERFPRKLTRLLLRVERIDWDECPDESAALTRERELIRALQPRFNTIGVRPPKVWFVCWRQRGNTLTLALDESPVGWPSVRGPFVFARLAFSALLRSLWLELNPGASVVELPSRLLPWSGPTRWSVMWSDAVAAWFKEMESFLDGGQSRLLSSIVPAPRHPKLNPTPTHAPDRSPDAQITIMSRMKSADASSVCHPGDAECPEIREEPPPSLTFGEQWRAMDAKCLAEFYERLHPREGSS